MTPASDGRTPATDAQVVAGIIVTLAIPAVLTLRAVRVPQAVVPVADNPTPLGYTRSLSLFVVPAAVLAWWFLRHPGLPLPAEGLRAHPGRPGPARLPPGHPLRPRLLHLREPGGDAGRRGPRRRRLRPRRGVRLLRLRLPHDAPALHLVRRVLARRLPASRTTRPRARDIARVIRFHLPSLLIGVALAARRGRLQAVLLRDARGSSPATTCSWSPRRWCRACSCSRRPCPSSTGGR